MPIIKRCVKQICKRLPYLNIIFVAEQLIRSINEVILEDWVRDHVTDVTCFRKTSIEYYRFTADMPPAFRTEMYFSQRHVYQLKDVTVNTSMGACCTSDHGFLESFGSLRSWILSRPMVIRQSKDDCGICGPVICVNSTGFAHFLLEELPRLLWALKSFPEANLLRPVKVPKFIENFYRELMTRGVLGKAPVTTPKRLVHVQDFIFTQAESYSGFWHKDDLALLREVFLKPTSCGNPLRIYISRRNSPRSFDNEKNLEETLKTLGVEIVYLERLSISEQVQKFQNAELIVAPHGAGLANLVWCSPGTKVVEIFSPEVFNDCFARLSSQMSCSHYCLWAKSTAKGFGEVDIDSVMGLIANG